MALQEPSEPNTTITTPNHGSNIHTILEDTTDRREDVSREINKLLPWLTAAAIATGVVTIPSEAYADHPNIIGLRERLNVRVEIPNFVAKSEGFGDKLTIEALGTHSTWNNELEGHLTLGTGIDRKNGFFNVSGGASVGNCMGGNPSTLTGTNCSTINNHQPNVRQQTATLGGGTFNLAGGAAFGPVTLNLNGAALLNGNGVSLLGKAKLAWQLFNDEKGGFALSADAQVRDNVFIVGGGLGYRVIWGTYGNEGRVNAIQLSNNWYLYTDGSGRKDVISFLNLGFSSEMNKSSDSSLWKFSL